MKIEKYQVIDDFKVSRFGHHGPLDPIHFKDNFVSDVYFYNSMRVDGNKNVTDIAVVSTLTKEQLYDFEYSDTMSMFKLKKQLADKGHVGIIESKKYLNGKNSIKKLELKHVKRYVNPIDSNKYEDSKSVKFFSLSAKEILGGRIPEG